MDDTQIQGLRFLESNRDFLGTEFLTWLYFSLQHNPTNKKTWESCVIGLGSKITIEGRSVSSCHKGDHVSNSIHLANLLINNQKVTEIDLTLYKDDQIWQFTLKTDLQPRKVKLPPIKDATDAGQYHIARVELLEYVTDFIDAKFKEYLELRQDELRFTTFKTLFTSTLMGD